MAKLKKETDDLELSQADMEAKFLGEEGEETSKSKKVKVKTKTTFSLSDYKKEKNASSGKFKPQTWIRMSPAFQEITGLPGAIAEGQITQVIGPSDSGKSTMLLEAAKYAQLQGIVPIFIITEKKWSHLRCVDMGIDLENCIMKDDIDFIEQGCDFIEDILRDQEEGKFPHDVVFLWDSIGATPSKKEFQAAEDGESAGGLMVTARVLRERITRRIAYKINNTRKEDYPYNASMLVVNHAYQAPPSFPGGQTTLKPYGGDGIWLASALVFRMGGITSRSSKVKATKDGVQMAFAIKSALVIEKNHITSASPDGRIICTNHGFILDTKESLDDYKKKYKDGWNLEFDKDWNSVTKE